MKIHNYELMKDKLGEYTFKLEDGVLYLVNDTNKIEPKKHNKCFGRGWQGKKVDAYGNVIDEYIVCDCLLRRLQDVRKEGLQKMSQEEGVL